LRQIHSFELSPADFVLDGDPAPSQKGGGAPSPIFGKFLLWPNGWMHHDATWYLGRLSPGDFVFDWDPAPPQKGRSPSPIFGSCLLWPNGWMDQVGTWYGGGLWWRPHCAKRGQSPSIFGPFLLSPNGWMHQDATWYGGRPRPRRLCVRWGPSSVLSKKGAEPLPNFRPVFCGQTAGWIKTPVSREVDLGPGHFVLDGFPAIGVRGTAAPPLFGPCL